MGHSVLKSGYLKLTDRLNKVPQGAPPSELLYQILEILFSEKEAELVSLLPVKPFTAEKAAKIWKKSEKETRIILDELSGRATLLDVVENGESVYVLPPPMAGFFEFSMMRVRKDVDQKLLAELYYEYLNVEDDFVKALFADGETQIGRAYVNEPALPPENSFEVLDYERATEVIKTSPEIGISMCYCRHKMEHKGLACGAPMDICMTFNNSAESLIKHGAARKVSVQECLDLLDEAYDNNLVQFGDNVREGVNFICNCCGCCCEAMLAAKKFGFLNPVNTTNYLPVIEEKECSGCGKCVEVCPVEAMSMISANDPHKIKLKKAKLIPEICLGCGVCVRVCPKKCINLVEREEKVITPINSVYRTVLMAIERGKLQNLIYDNQALWNHRAMAAILGVIFKLPPAKQILANKQIQSRYIEKMVLKLDY